MVCQQGKRDRCPVEIRGKAENDRKEVEGGHITYIVTIEVNDPKFTPSSPPKFAPLRTL